MVARKYNVLLLVALLSGCGQPTSQIDPIAPLPLSVSREQVELDTALPSNYTDAEAADLLRNFIHAKIPYNYKEALVFWDPTKYDALIAGDLSLQCGEQANTYRSLLDALGIPSRFVWVIHHQTTEVFTDGKWWLSDPTFNLYILCNGVRASAVEARACDNPVIVEAGVAPNPNVRDSFGPGSSYIDILQGITYEYEKAAKGELEFLDQ